MEDYDYDEPIEFADQILVSDQIGLASETFDKVLNNLRNTGISQIKSRYK